MQPLLAITMGDINGVGPEILAKALSHKELCKLFRPLVIGSAAVLDTARQTFPDCPKPKVVENVTTASWDETSVPVLEAGVTAPPYIPGHLDPEAGRCAIAWLKQAVALAMAAEVAAIVTCPINKEGIHRAGYTCQGHTDLIAELTGAPHYAMSVFADGMRAVHVSAHLSLVDAIAYLTEERIATTIRIAHEALTRLALPRRRIAVAGLNPHAGEAGAFGNEEVTIITPAIERCRSEGVDCSGPYPADTVFRRMQMGEFDLVVAMYHDQGHIPLKLVAMDRGVNVTLGIPIVRTSVDHGTAYDIAGKGTASEESLCCAIRLAAEMAAHS